MIRSANIGRTCACVLTLAAAPIAAQTSYPTHQIRIVCPFPAGGGTDLTARLLGEQLHKTMGQPVIVDNRTGASGMIGTGHVAKANPDGYTIIVNNIGLAVNETLRPDRGYEALKALTPISLVGFTPSVLVSCPTDSLTNSL